MGLILFVARSTGPDCSNHGISYLANQLCAVNVSGPFEPSEDCPAVLLESHYDGILRIVPAYKQKDGKWEGPKAHVMFGGNYASTSDGRFANACEKLLGHRFYGAVCIHDRFETAEQSEALSR